jgi:putative restriction endonuclease
MPTDRDQDAIAGSPCLRVSETPPMPLTGRSGPLPFVSPHTFPAHDTVRSLGLAARARPRPASPPQFLLDRGRDEEYLASQGANFGRGRVDVELTDVGVPDSPCPYNDELGPDGFLRYRYRGTNPHHRDNVGLRLAMRRGVPLVYFFGVTPGRYLPVWPVFVVRDHPGELAFSVPVDAPYQPVLGGLPPEPASLEARRAYVTVLTQRRVHQQSFRERVLQAYQSQCAICRLRHAELLEAAHILPDGHPQGEPVVPNGLALCMLHHAAFDRHILGIRPDRLTVEVRVDVLREADGPMLRHGLQGFQNVEILTPRSAELKPRREFLAERYEVFKRAG